MNICVIEKQTTFVISHQIWVKTCIASKQVHIYYMHLVFVFTLQIARATVTMKILGSFSVKHHFVIVLIVALNTP